MSCVFKHKESKINTLSELKEQGILDGPYLKDDKETEFNNYHNNLIESVQENYNLGIDKFFNILEQKTSSVFGIVKKFVQPIDSSFKQLDQARKDLGIYDTKESYLSFKEAAEAKSIKLNEVTNIKPGVQELFDSNPELANIGSSEQYSQYLDTIFPDSQVKDIVYRGDTSKQINNRGLKDFLKGVRTDLLYLTTNADVAKNELYRSDYSEFIYKKDDKGNLSLTSEDKEDETKGLVRGPKNFFAAIVNLKNPIIKDAKNQSYKNYKIENQYELDILKNAREKIKNKEADSLIIKNVLEGVGQNIQSTTIGIRLPEQIHILGNKQDIEGFKEFVNKDEIKTTEQSNTNISLLNEDIGIKLDINTPEGAAFINAINNGDIESTNCK